MNRTIIVLLMMMSFALLPCVPVALACAAELTQTVAVYFQLDGVPGESADVQHKDQIEVQSFSLSGQHPGGPDGKPSLGEFFILKPIDAASPKLLVALATGQKIATAAVTVVGKVGEKEPRAYLKYTFTGLTVSRINQVVSGGGQEELNFRYASVEIEYTGANGTVVKEKWENAK